MNAAEFLARCLKNEGVETAFGLPGEETAALVAALERAGIRLITAHSPAAAAWMAATEGSAHRRPGVVFAGAGAAALKLAPALAACTADGFPVVALVGAPSLSEQMSVNPESLDLSWALRPACKQTASLNWGPGIRDEVREGFRLAMRERPGAVALVLPEDIARVPVPAGLEPVARRPAGEPVPDPQAVEQAAQRLDGASRPVVLAGHGVVREGAHAELLALAEKAGIPVVTTYMAKSAMPFGHPRLAGYGGPGAIPAVTRLLQEADVILTAGFDRREWDPSIWNPRLEASILHLGATPARVSVHYGPVVEMVGKLQPGLSRLTAQLEPRDRRHWAGPEGAAARARKSLEEELEAAQVAGFIPTHPGRVIADLRRMLGNHDLLTVDSGAHQAWAGRLYPCYQPGTYYTSGAMRAVGFALPAAIGLALSFARRGNHRVAALMGDGGFMQQALELRTAVRLGLPLICVVLCDGRFAAVEQHALRESGIAPAAQFGPLSAADVARVAEALGARGLVAEHPQELPHRLESARGSDGPAVVAVAVTANAHLDLVRQGVESGPGVG